MTSTNSRPPGQGRTANPLGTISSKHPGQDCTTTRGAVQIRRADGKIVGSVAAGIFKKAVRGSAHFLRVPRAICNDISVLQEAERLGVSIVEIYDSESGKVYRASLARIWSRGFRVNRGFGEQIGLLLSEWSRDGEPVGQQLSFLGRL